jgi:serine/threonine-protein kinase
MGKVYEATERLSGRRVALKLLRPELARSEPVRRLFENEMSILSGLDHPNVVRCLSCAEVGGELMMALELLSGRTLREVLRDEGPLEWTRAVGIAEQIARALAAAHEHETPIVHRDLKPENVMVMDDGAVKVTDFGVAKLVAALGNESTHSAGTLAYMSPEQIDAGPVDARSDLYALGVVLYELIAGRPPFHSTSPRELLNLACTKPPPPFPDDVRAGLPRGVVKLVFELLEKSPEARPGSAADVLAELEPFAPGAPEAAPRSPRRRAATLPSVERPPVLRAERTAHDDTIAMLERARLPRDVSLRTAVLVIAALSALSGVFTYALTVRGEAPPKAVVAGGSVP